MPDADGQQADPDEEAEAHAPDEGGEAGAEGWRTEMHAPATLPQSEKNSPSGSRFRPPHPPTFRFRVQPSGEASTYSRSLLGADGNLEGRKPSRKYLSILIRAICEKSIFPQFPHTCDALWTGL